MSVTLSPSDLNDIIIISIIIENFIIRKVIVDQGSAVDILFYPTFKKMQIDEIALSPYTRDLEYTKAKSSTRCLNLGLNGEMERETHQRKSGSGKEEQNGEVTRST